MQKEFYLYFDESGNLGKQGRYFVIACILTESPKALHNIMKKKLLGIKTKYPHIKTDGFEIKAKDANREIKTKILEAMITKDIRISYIVADLAYIDEKLLKNKNLFYNYMLKILLDNFKSLFRDNKVNMILDNKSIKVKSLNSFKDYITIHLNYELGLNSDLVIEYRDSKAGDAFNIQAADYVANALYSYYEYKNSCYKDKIQCKFQYVELFPKYKFGKALPGEELTAATK